ncbi:hypothetical protein ACFFUB_05095 [Algimonas porphyrae]|uniref:DUF485 domain-containing protein n=1 Tax=Algimonas porphyrae TaxID=1128113 RepID=A0ABQ5UYR4_9PROT|nr:hypothetical protein [Algimonas porphyrae]GLQ19847.1 hypothetical protein GCM10007854_08020 [Algimonas porphyrae]
MNGPHFQIHRYSRRVKGVPITLVGWVLFLIYLGITLSGFVFIAKTAELAALPLVQFLFIVIILIAIIVAGLLFMMWTLGEIVDHR